jgi:glycosyltransferase involved in cell wall biosynthesis
VKASLQASVIIPTYNGAQKIGFLLDALLGQSIRDFEVVVVVDGSGDNTQEVLTYYKPFFNAFKIIVQPNKGRSAVRNRGVKEAEAGLVVFYDDDMVPAPDSVERHVQFHLDKNGNSILTGYTPQVIGDRSNDFTVYRAYLSEQWIRNVLNTRTPLDKQNLFLTAANCSLHKATFIQLNGFDENLSDGEDNDLAKRAFKENVSLFFDKENIAFHNEQINCKSYIVRLREYALAEKKIERLNNRLITKVKVKALRRPLYFLVASRWLVRIVDSFNVFIVLPRWIRYKLYDAMIFSLSELYPEVRL